MNSIRQYQVPLQKYMAMMDLQVPVLHGHVWLSHDNLIAPWNCTLRWICANP